MRKYQNTDLNNQYLLLGEQNFPCPFCGINVDGKWIQSKLKYNFDCRNRCFFMDALSNGMTFGMTFGMSSSKHKISFKYSFDISECKNNYFSKESFYLNVTPDLLNLHSFITFIKNKMAILEFYV
jgi:hypothetical protein